jgi:hypothetical protein
MNTRARPWRAGVGGGNPAGPVAFGGESFRRDRLKSHRVTSARLPIKATNAPTNTSTFDRSLVESLTGTVDSAVVVVDAGAVVVVVGAVVGAVDVAVVGAAALVGAVVVIVGPVVGPVDVAVVGRDPVSLARNELMDSTTAPAARSSAATMSAAIQCLFRRSLGAGGSTPAMPSVRRVETIL